MIDGSPECPVEKEDARGGRSPFAEVAVPATAVALGFLFAGLPGAVLVGGLLLVARGPALRPAAAVTSGALFLVAVVATVTEAPLGTSEVNLDYATSRPIASAAGGLAAAALAVVLVDAWSTESSPRSRRGPGVAVRVSDGSRGARLALGGVWTYVPAVLLSLLVMVAQGQAALPASWAPLVASLRSGTGYSMGNGIPASLPPLPAVMSAFAPFSPEIALWVTSALGVVAAMRLAQRLGGVWSAWLVGPLAALVPLAGGHDLPAALAALLVTSGLAWAWPVPLTARRGTLAGMCLAGAVQARPDSVLAFIAVLAGTAVATAVSSRPRRPAPVTALVVAFALASAPWLLWLYDRFGAWLSVQPLPGPRSWIEWAGLPALAIAAGCVGRRRQGLGVEA